MNYFLLIRHCTKDLIFNILVYCFVYNFFYDIEFKLKLTELFHVLNNGDSIVFGFFMLPVSVILHYNCVKKISTMVEEVLPISKDNLIKNLTTYSFTNPVFRLDCIHDSMLVFSSTIQGHTYNTLVTFTGDKEVKVRTNKYLLYRVKCYCGLKT